MSRICGIASGESCGRKRAAGVKPLVARQTVTLRLTRAVLLRRFGVAMSRCADSICRTAGYVTRMSGGVGGRGREVPSYPD